MMSSPAGQFKQAKALDAMGVRLDIPRLFKETNNEYLKRIMNNPLVKGKRDELLKIAAEEGVVTTSIRLEVESSPSATLLEEISKL